jgi:hypothetical protein
LCPGIPKGNTDLANKNNIKQINHRQLNTNKESFLYQNALNNNNNKKIANDSFDYHSNNNPNFPYYNLYADELNNLNNAQKNFYSNNFAINAEANRENIRDKSPLNNLKSVTKTAKAHKNPRAFVYDHIADTVRSVSNSKKTLSSKNKIYIRNKSKNNYETTKNNIFPTQKNNNDKSKRSKSKGRHQKINKNKNFYLNADVKNYSNFNTEPCNYGTNSNNIKDNYNRNLINYPHRDINNSRNHHINNNIGSNNYNNNKNYAEKNEAANANYYRIIQEEKAKNNNYFINQNDIQRERQIEHAIAQKSYELGNYTNSRSNSGYARKPSSEWRKGESSLERQRTQNAYHNLNINNSVNYAENQMRSNNSYNDMNFNPSKNFNNQGKLKFLKIYKA